ncbi:MAG: DnaA/Hda family protein [Candidatus Edwardsbacteria bacterium]|nr:DnaA/Hda family protein [Candidatus Edwardsbacteria bacterium]
MPQEFPDILKSTYLFESFVTGPNSRLAFAAARKVADQPGVLYNPLVIYGGVGLGKTHLLQAIGNAVAVIHPDWKIAVLNGSQLRIEDIAPAEQADLLLVDDLHLGLDNRDVQIRLIPLFDRMTGTNRQIALTTDTSPQKIESLDPKLLSRLLGGVIVALKEIDTNEKVIILSKKARSRGVAIPDDVLFLLAARVPSNIRELEGALNKVLLYASLFDGQVTRTILDETLPPTVPSEQAVTDAVLAAAPEPVTAPDEDLAAGEFGEFITGLDHKVTDLIMEQQDAEKLRQDYKDRVNVWKMKGFNTAGIEKHLEQDLSALTAEYDRFTTGVERMIGLQQEFGRMAAKTTPDEIAQIESLLFDPDQVDRLAAGVEALRERIAGEPAPVAEPEPAPAAVTPEAIAAAILKQAAHPPPYQLAKLEPVLTGAIGTVIEAWPWIEDRLIDDI